MSDAGVSARQLVRTIRLDDAAVARILDGLDKVQSDGHPERQSERFRYRMKAVIVHMHQPGGKGTLPHLVPTRNISEGGMSFLHGGFVHKETRCLVQLISSDEKCDNVIGTVVRCEYIDNNIHEVCLRFDRNVDPSSFTPEVV